jgi:hypothetical protein
VNNNQDPLSGCLLVLFVVFLAIFCFIFIAIAWVVERVQALFAWCGEHLTEILVIGGTAVGFVIALVVLGIVAAVLLGRRGTASDWEE